MLKACAIDTGSDEMLPVDSLRLFIILVSIPAYDKMIFMS